MNKLLVDKKSGKDIKINLRDIIIGGKEKIIISGPCAVESYDSMINIAKKLKDLGVHMLRGGVFKPRTSPYDFQGLESGGLEILKCVGKEVDMPVSTEIMDTREVEKALDYIDVIQIGSRNMYNYSLLKEVGKTNKKVLLKRAMSATIEEWLNAAEYIAIEGKSEVILCERGIRTFETYTRNTLDLNCIPVIKEKTNLKIIVDPSHGTGRRELIKPMSNSAIAAGADGLIIEMHPSPDSALSDGDQSVNFDEFKAIYMNSIKLYSYMKNME